ncbi:hypothetical protein U1Q18_020756 [Sarracenia purpurea var. burkii]
MCILVLMQRCSPAPFLLTEITGVSVLEDQVKGVSRALMRVGIFFQPHFNGQDFCRQSPEWDPAGFYPVGLWEDIYGVSH